MLESFTRFVALQTNNDLEVALGRVFSVEKDNTEDWHYVSSSHVECITNPILSNTQPTNAEIGQFEQDYKSFRESMKKQLERLEAAVRLKMLVALFR